MGVSSADVPTTTETGNGSVVLTKNAHLSEAQRRFIELEKKKEDVKNYFKELKNACEAVYAELGFNKMFQDSEGTVYRIVEPEGRYVEFDKIGYERTRRNGEKQGTISLKDARDAGFTVE